jgi:uncharacterized protein (DUF433 family)
MTTVQHQFDPEPVPLWTDKRGDIRVRGTRILFDVIIDCYRQGMSPEDITNGYPNLGLADVHAILAYYFRHQPTMDEYLQKRDEDSQKIRQEIESRQKPLSDALKARMDAIKDQRKAARDKPSV